MLRGFSTLVWAVVAIIPAAHAQKIYWTAPYELQRSNLDGSGIETLATGLAFGHELKVDSVSGKVYWADGGAGSIHRANLDGSNPETLVSGEPDPIGLWLELAAGKMYWTEGDARTIRRSNLDGSNIELVLGGLGYFPWGLAVDSTAGKIYFTQAGDIGSGSPPGYIRRCNLDGSNAETLLDVGVGRPLGLALHDGSIYWAEWNAGRIRRASLDGSGAVDVIIGITHVFGPAIDSVNEKIYWTRDSGTIQRANLDGSAVETIVSGIPIPIGVAIDVPIPNQQPLAEAGPGQSVNEGDFVTLDGSGSSDPDGDPLTYTWAKVAGPPVTLNTVDPVHPTFTAPLVPVGGATLTFELIVHDGQVASEPHTVDITIKNVNHEPEAHAGDDQAVAEGAPVTLDGTASYDPDNDGITLVWEQIAGFSVTLASADTAEPAFTAPWVGHSGETLSFRLTASDGNLSDTDTINVLVEDINHDPSAVAGPNQTRNEGVQITLDGTASSDPDGDPVTYSWEQIGGSTVTPSNPNSPTPTFTAPAVVGVTSVTLTFRLTVDDGWGGSDSDDVVITVLDTNAPPACELARPSLDVLWPPNHKMQSISILGVTDPENGNVTITIFDVTQDEPINGLGDGDTDPDAVIQGDTVLIRKERAGGGNGRVYTIHFEADDGVNGVCTGAVTVRV